jgi:low temperature requirement protein LtrA
MQDVSGDHRVTPLELFFDLVFVFAVTQVTATLADDVSWAGLGRGLLVVASLWWAWGAYAWLTNASEHRQPMVRVFMFGAMAAMLIAAITLPDAFGNHAIAFGLAYLVFRVLHVILFWIAGRNERGIRQALARLSPYFLAAPVLLAIGGFLGGQSQVILWIAAVLVDYLSPVVRGMAGWRVAPAHFVERHGLIVIIALGESIVAVGVGASGLQIDLSMVTATVLTVFVAACLWWAYFDGQPERAEHRLATAAELPRAVLARNLYSYLHLPMVGGIILLALGVKKTLGHTADPLTVIPAVALGGGVALYLAALVAFRLVAERTWSLPRVVAALASLATIPVATAVSALAALEALTAVIAVLTAWEVRAARTTTRVPPGTGGGQVGSIPG